MIEITQGDITQADTQAIVNAANEQLILGGGVAGAILRSGGAGIQEECNLLAPIKTGDAVITGAGDLPQRYVIHAVAPRGEIDGWQDLVVRCMNSILTVCEKNDIESVAIPAVGTGIFGLPGQTVAELLVGTAKSFECQTLKRIVFVLFDGKTLQWFQQANAQEG